MLSNRAREERVKGSREALEEALHVVPLGRRGTYCLDA